MRREAGGERQQAAENERAEVDEHLNHLGASVPRTSAGGFGEPIRYRGAISISVAIRDVQLGYS